MKASWPAVVMRLLWRAVMGWMNDRGTRLAASLSFFTMLSLGPLLLITLQIVGMLLGEEAASGQLEAYLRQMVGERGAEVMRDIVAAADKSDGGPLATAVSIGILIFTASYVFAELQDAMNIVWDVKTAEGWAIKRMIMNRLVAFMMVLSLAFLLLVSLLLSSWLAALSAYIAPNAGRLAQALDFFVSLVVISGLFALLFKYIPDVHLRWSEVWPGAVFTGVAFAVGRFVLSMYLGRAVAVSFFGAAGSLVALLLWVYYSAMIMFFGAEFTKSYTDWRRGRVQ